MRGKLKILESFLKKGGFLVESKLCGELAKTAIPLLENPFTKTKTDFRVTPKDLKKTREHGWVYILKTEPTTSPDGLKNSENGWYVGSTGSPATRWVEHLYGSKRDEGGNYFIPNPSEVEEAVMSAIEKEEHVKGSRFTTRHQVKEIACMELIAYDKDISSDIARKRREKQIFQNLAEIVGSKNIGGDYHSMLWSKKKDFPPKYVEEAEIKAKIQEITSCDKATVLTSALNNMSYEDITDSDLSFISKRREWFEYSRRDDIRKRRKIYKEINSLSEPEKRETADFIKKTYEETDDFNEVLRILEIEDKGSFLSTISALGLNWQEMQFEKEREEILWALNNSATFTDAKEKLGLAPNSMTLKRKMKRLGIDGRKELGTKRLDQDAHLVAYIENLIRTSTSFSTVIRGTGMSQWNLEQFMSRNNLSRDMLGADFPDILRETLRGSRTIMEAAKKLGKNTRSTVRELARKYNVNLDEELGGDLPAEGNDFS